MKFKRCNSAIEYVDDHVMYRCRHEEGHKEAHQIDLQYGGTQWTTDEDGYVTTYPSDPVRYPPITATEGTQANQT